MHVFKFLHLRSAGLAALVLCALAAATLGRAELILYARQGGPMEYNYQGPVAALFTLEEPTRIQRVAAWVNGSDWVPAANLSIAANLGDYPLYSTTFSIDSVLNAPAKWQAVSGLKWDLQPGSYWLRFDGGDYPFGYGYYGSVPAAPYPEDFATRWPDGGALTDWTETSYPFGLQVNAVALSAVPEPGTYGLFAALGLMAIAWRRRTRRDQAINR